MLILAKNAEIMLLLFTLSQVKTPQQVPNKQVDAKHIYPVHLHLESLRVHCLTNLKQ